MKYLAYILALVFVLALFSSCASSGGKQNYSGCQAQKTNNHKSGKTFIY